jgi:hypothetical protein
MASISRKIDRTIMFRSRQGWFYDTFKIYQSLFCSADPVNFDFLSVMTRLDPLRSSRSRFTFLLLKETDDTTLAPFRLFESVEVFDSFRSMLGTVSKDSASLVLLFCSSGIRFRFLARASHFCPCCGTPWLTSHFFTCTVVEPQLARNDIYLASFQESLRVGEWAKVLFLIYEMLLLWKSWFVSDCILDDAALTNLKTDGEFLRASR